jgi:hypothetical protein
LSCEVERPVGRDAGDQHFQRLTRRMTLAIWRRLKTSTGAREQRISEARPQSRQRVAGGGLRQAKPGGCRWSPPT